MAYKRYRKGGARRYRRKPRYTTMGSAAHLAKKAWGVAKYVKSIVNTEYKVCDTDINFQCDNLAYDIQLLTGLTQGNNFNERNGNSVLAKSLYINGRIYLGTGFNHAVVRLMLVEYKSCQGANPAVGDIMVTTTTDQAVNSFRQVGNANSKNYKIWWDKRYSLDSDFKDEIFISKYIKMTHHMKYIGTGSTVASCGAGNFFLLAVSTSTNNAGVFPINFNGKIRTRYIDN